MFYSDDKNSGGLFPASAKLPIYLTLGWVALMGTMGAIAYMIAH